MARIAHFLLGKDRFAIDLAALSGIERTDRLQRVPTEPTATSHPSAAAPVSAIGWLLGPREDLPVYRLSQLLGVPQPEEGPREGVVLVCAATSGGAAGSFGLLVDELERSRDSAVAVHALPEPFRRAGVAAFSGVVRSAGALSLLVDPARLLSDGRGAGSAGEEGLSRVGAVEDVPAPCAAGSARPASRVLLADLSVEDPVGRRTFAALAAGQVREVTEALPTLAVPGAPSRLPGLILWRDQPLPLLDLAAGLDGWSRPAIPRREPRRFVIADAGRQILALPVGRDVRFERLPLPATEPIEIEPALVELGVRAGYVQAGSLLLVFDLGHSLLRGQLT